MMDDNWYSDDDFSDDDNVYDWDGDEVCLIR